MQLDDMIKCPGCSRDPLSRRSTTESERREEVHLEHRPQIGLGHVKQARARAVAGIGEDHIDTAEAIHPPSQDLFRSTGGCNVDGDDLRRCPNRSTGRGHVPESILSTCDEHQLHPRRRASPRRGSTDA